LISRQDILDFSRGYGLRPTIVEKDYVLGWILAGIFANIELSRKWIFKGGTCLKKCFFETYRFSEDLDFTLTDPAHLNELFLKNILSDVSRWVYEQSGIEMPTDPMRFEVYENPRGRLSAQGRISYRGPLLPGGDLPRVKLDLTDDELVALNPVTREVHHPYPDRPDEGIRIQCYAYEELFAEKLRALAERERPRDLYDVIHLYRFSDDVTDRVLIRDTLKRKCEYKDIELPSIAILEAQSERAELESEWGNMLGHQLPMLPPFDQFWQELPEVLEWLYGRAAKAVVQSLPLSPEEDPTWRPPPMAQLWGVGVSPQAPLEVIRFAAANRLCVDLGYNRSRRLIEPYSLRRTKDGNLLLHAVRHESGEHRAYRIEKIESVLISQTPFVPKYAIELTQSGLISAPLSVGRLSTISSGRPHRSPAYGPFYVVECTVCGRRFEHKNRDLKLHKHNDKQGHPCYSRRGFLAEIKR
jgi:predicted nucleotidyltransferase component of viral defense system